jgi:hypothetical protein
MVANWKELQTTEESGSDYDFPETMDEEYILSNLVQGLDK